MTDQEPRVVLVDPAEEMAGAAAALAARGVGVERVPAPADAAARDADCVVVLDAPGVDGADLLGAVGERLPSVPAVVYSVGTAPDLVHRALAAGAADVVSLAADEDPADRGDELARRVRAAAGVDVRSQTPAALLASLFEHVPHHIFIKDETGRIVDASRATAEEYDLTREQIVGLTDAELLDHASAAETREQEHRIMATGEPLLNHVEHYVDDAGRDRWVSTTKAPRYDAEGRVVGVIGTTRDVTEEKRQERLVRSLHEASRRLYEQATAAAIAAAAVDIAGDVPALPTVAVALYDDGTEAAGAAEDGVALAAGDAGAFDPYRRFYEAAVERGAPRYVVDRGDGDPEAGPRPPRAEGGTTTGEAAPGGADAAEPALVVLPVDGYGALGLLFGASSYEPLGEDLGQVLAANLATALERVEREELLREREAELSRQNERLEEFAGIVSHDLRNPLNVAQGYLDRVAAGDDDAVAEVRGALDRMDSMIEELLALAREGGTGGSVDPAPVDLAAAARDAWGAIDAPRASLDAAAADVAVQADRDRLIELLENLFRNAVEHGGPAVTVTVEGTPAGFAVADDGPGLPEDGRDRLFEMGFSTDGDGTGYGLYVVRTIAEGHGWTVRAGASDAGGSSERGSGGARFAFEGVERA